MYKYLKGSAKEAYTRLCLSPEGDVITIQTGSQKCGVLSEDYIWVFDPDNYNYGGCFNINQSRFSEYGITEIPKPLPLPDNLRALLKRTKESEFFHAESWNDDWVHTHFRELYKSNNIGHFPLFGGDEDGAIYIEPSNRPGVILFCGRGSLACYYELDLNAI